MLRILHIFDHSVPYFSGYTFRSGYILERQRAQGFEPVVLTSLKHWKQEAGREVVDQQVYYRTPHFKSALGRRAFRTPLLGEGLHMHRLYRRIISLRDEAAFDLIHAHSPALNGLPGLHAGRRMGLPVVYEIRAFWEDAGVDLGTYSSERSLKYKCVRALETYLCRRADAVTTICEGLKRDLLDRGIPAERITVIPNGVDPARFVPRPRDRELMAALRLEPGKVLGFIGSFYDYEGLDILLQAYARVREQRPEMKLLLVGGGYQGQEEKLRAQAGELGLGEGAVFTGRVPHGEVHRYYSVIDLFVYPRRRMRLTELVTPLKPLEAMAMGKAVLGSSVGGIAELVKEGRNGFLFPPDDPEAAAQRILSLTEDPGPLAALGEQARRYVLEERNWDRIVARYGGVYEAARRRCRERGGGGHAHPA